MKVLKFIAAGCFPLAILLSWTVPAPAAASSATLHVQATIRPWLKFSASQTFGSYQVTEQDLRRGYLDLPQALTLEMQTNIPEEVRFDISSNGPERILLHEGGSGLAGALRIVGNHPAVPVTRVLDLRIVLPESAQKGTYPLQVALAPMAY